MFGAIPPLFLPILSVLLVLIAGYPGFIRPVVENRRKRAEKLWNEVDATYQHITWIHKDELCDRRWDHDDYNLVREEAQNHVDVLRGKLLRNPEGSIVPSRIKIDDEESIREWYEFLRDERGRRAR